MKSTMEMNLPSYELNILGKRLDHALTHTQTASKLIYLVDGAVLALVYFIIGKFEVSRRAVSISAFPILILALLNYFHSEFVRLQQHWYYKIDKRLRERLGEAGLPKIKKSII